MNLLINLPTPAKIVLVLLAVTEVLILVLLYKRGKQLKTNAAGRPADQSQKPLPESTSFTLIRKKIALAVIAVAIVALPVIVYAALRTQSVKPLAQGSDTYLNQTWLELASPEHNLYLTHTKCLRPYSYPNPPYGGKAGWILRCEDGRSRIEIIITDFSFQETYQRNSVSPDLNFKKYSTPHFSGWKGSIPNKTVYYFLERPGNSNILLIGNLDAFDEPGNYAQLLIEHTAESIRNLN